MWRKKEEEKGERRTVPVRFHPSRLSSLPPLRQTQLFRLLLQPRNIRAPAATPRTASNPDGQVIATGVPRGWRRRKGKGESVAHL